MRQIPLAIALASGVAIAGWAAPGAAQPVGPSGSLEVRLTIEESCDISGNTGEGSIGGAVLDFGTHSALETAIDRDVSTSPGLGLQVLCNPGAEYTLTFNQGLHAADGTIQSRRMQRLGSSTDFVSYQLYADAGRTTVLDTITGVGTGTAVAHNVWGRIPVQSAPTVGEYRDTVTITMSF